MAVEAEPGLLVIDKAQLLGKAKAGASLLDLMTIADARLVSGALTNTQLLLQLEVDCPFQRRPEPDRVDHATARASLDEVTSILIVLLGADGEVDEQITADSATGEAPEQCVARVGEQRCPASSSGFSLGIHKEWRS